MKNGRLHARSMFSSTVLTCLGNDYKYEEIFSKQLELLAEKEDILVAISSSGNSANIINAIKHEICCHMFCNSRTSTISNKKYLFMIHFCFLKYRNKSFY